MFVTLPVGSARAVVRYLVAWLCVTASLCAEDAARLLAEADRLAWLNNWVSAGPLFARAEQLYTEKGDARNALYAKISRLRAEVDSMSYVEVAAYLGRLLELPIVQGDAKLKLRCLTGKASIDILLESTAASRPIWEQVWALARELGDKGWEARASGELGIAAFLEGDSASALSLTAEALTGAKKSSDIGAQVRYMSLVGCALIQFGRHESALEYFDRAIALAAGTVLLYRVAVPENTGGVKGGRGEGSVVVVEAGQKLRFRLP